MFVAICAFYLYLLHRKMKTLLKMLMFHAMGTQILIFTSMLFLIHIGTVDGDSCVNYQDPSTCGAHSICIWDSDLSRCVCNSVVPQDIVIIMDSSGSVRHEDLRSLRRPSFATNWDGTRTALSCSPWSITWNIRGVGPT